MQSLTVTVDGYDGATYRAPSTLSPIVLSGAKYWMVASIPLNYRGALWHHSQNLGSTKDVGLKTSNSDWKFSNDWSGPALRVEGVPIPEPSNAVLGSLASAAIASLHQLRPARRLRV